MAWTKDLNDKDVIFVKVKITIRHIVISLSLDEQLEQTRGIVLVDVCFESHLVYDLLNSQWFDNVGSLHVTNLSYGFVKNRRPNQDKVDFL